METLNAANLSERVKDYLANVKEIVKTKKFWVELVIMTLGMFVAAIGIHFFLVPSKLIVGSITGLSLVIAKLMPFVSVGTVIFIINAILLVLSFLLIGNEFGAKTVYTALILGPMVDFLAFICPMEESLFNQYVNGVAVTSPWFDLLCFVILLSASQSILFNINASTGGLDILAKIVNKYAHINLGTSVTIAGGIICCTAFAINPVGLVIIGIIGTWINGLILNHFMTGLNSKVRVYIISDEYQKIQEYIIHGMPRGCTLHEVTGGFSGEKKVQLEVILTREEHANLLEFIAREKISTFMSSDHVGSVYGIWNKKTNF